MPLPSLVSVKQIATGQYVGVEGDVSIERGATTFTAELPYRVVFDGPGSGAIQAMNATPAFGTVTAGLTVLGKHFKRVNATTWVITNKMGIPLPGQEAAPASLDEVDGSRWAVTVNINPVPVEMEIQRDIHGKMIQNAAGDAISGVMVDRYDEEIVWEFSTNVIDWNAIDLAYGPLGRGCVNSFDFTITINGSRRTFKAGQLRFMGQTVGATLDPSGNVYVRQTFRTRWRADGWIRQLANKGLKVKVLGFTFPLLTDPDPDGNKHVETTPQYLTADGTGKLADGDDVVMIPEELYEQADLGSILLWEMDS